MRKLLALLVLVVAATLTLTACGDDENTGAADDGGTGESATDFNEADVTFAQSMIPHHQQAVQMAEMAENRASSNEVKQLAADIEAAQEPEIETMEGWLEVWGEEIPSDPMGGGDHGMGDMDSEDMPGMMSGEDMGALERATGAAWDRMFLTMMIEHHEGAIEMARTEQAQGQHPDAVALAGQIIEDQRAEIAEMKQMLG